MTILQEQFLVAGESSALATGGDADNKAAPEAKASADERPRFVKIVGKTVIFMTIVSFLFVGILINIIQLILKLTLKFSDERWWRMMHKRINSYLLYALFSPPICLLYYWSNASLNIQLADKNLLGVVREKMLGIIIPNHSYELDYMICFVLADQLGNLGNYKSMPKDELKYLPIIGWALWMGDLVFVKRDWKQDRKHISHKLDQLFDYEQTVLGLFAEGTRWTPEKHQISVEYAKSRNMQPLRYHLIPRTRGFNYTIRHYVREIELNKRLDPSQLRLFNLEIVMPDIMNFSDFMNGRQLRADVYCEEIVLSETLRQQVVESTSEDDCPQLTQLIHGIYRRKDELVEEYKANGNKFVVDPEHGCPFPFKRGKLTLVIWFLGFFTTHFTLGYLATTLFADSIVFWSLLVGFITACVWMLRKIDQESRVITTTKGCVDIGEKNQSKVDVPTVDISVGDENSELQFLALSKKEKCVGDSSAY